MRVPTLFILLFKAALCVKTAAVAESPQEVSGYLGENITLPSGVDPSWSLIRIQWSIFTNITLIATYRNGTTNIKRFHQYTGRLTLNTRSGDLTIHNLKESDAIEYTVEVRNSAGERKANQIKITAKQKLEQPSIQTVTSTSVESGCLMVVTCSSPDEGVNLSWSVEPVSVLTINKSHPSDSSAQLFAFVSTKENFASFTCISSRDTESVSSKPVTPKCDSKICDSNCMTPPSPTTETQSCAGKIVISVIVTLGICGIIFFMIYRYQVKSYSLRSDLLWIIQTVVTLVQRRGVQRRTDNPGEALQNQDDQVHLQIQEATSQNDVSSLCPAAAVAAQRPSEEEQKRNQNEDSNKRASEQKETIQHNEENREPEQEQEEQVSRTSQQPQQEFLNECEDMTEDKWQTTIVFD